MYKFMFFFLCFFLTSINSFAIGLKGIYYTKDPYCADREELKTTIDPTINFSWDNKPICAPFDGIGSTNAVKRNDNWGIVWSGYINIPENKQLIIDRGFVTTRVAVDENTTFDTNSAGCGHPLDKSGAWSYNSAWGPNTKNGVKLDELSPGLHKIKIYTFVGAPACNDRYFSLMFKDVDPNIPNEPVPTENLFPYKIAEVSFEKNFYSLNEPNTGSEIIEIPINLSTQLKDDITIKFSTQDEIAKNNIDYKILNDTITIPKNETKAILKVEILKNYNNTNTRKTFNIQISQITPSKSIESTTDEEIGAILKQPYDSTRIEIVSKMGVGECIKEDPQDKSPAGFGWKRISAYTSAGTYSYYNDYDVIADKNGYKIAWNTEARNNGTKRLTINHGGPSKIGGIANISLGENGKGINISKSKTIIEFDYYAWGGEKQPNTYYIGERILPKVGIATETQENGGIGMAVILYDASIDEPRLADADSIDILAGMGYLSKNTKFTNGLLAIGLHQAQDFAQNANGLSGGQNNLSNSITIRGSVNQNAPFITSKQTYKLGDGNPKTDDYHAGRFKITLDSTTGNTLISVSRDDKIIIDKQDITSYLPKSGKFKVAFAASTKRYGYSNVHQIANVSIKSTDCGLSKQETYTLKVVERQFAEAHKANKAKYDFNWLWNSPLRTKIAGGAPLKPYEKNSNKIGYEYCVIGAKVEAGNAYPSTQSQNVYVTYSKIDDKELLKYKLGNKFNEDDLNNLYSNEQNLTTGNLPINNVEKEELVYSNGKDNLELTTDPNDITAACFVLHKNFTSNNITSHMYFNAYDLSIKSEDILKGIKSSNNPFAIKPAGFYMTFEEIDYANFPQRTPKLAIKPNKDYTKELIKTDDNNKINMPIKFFINDANVSILDSTTILNSSSIYKINATPMALNISNKQGDKYTYTLANAKNTNYYNLIETTYKTQPFHNFTLLRAITNNSMNCENDENLSLGKDSTIDPDILRITFRDSQIKYQNQTDSVKENLKINGILINDSEDLYLKYDNVMKFENLLKDPYWTAINFINIYKNNKNKLTAEEKIALSQNLKNYGYQCRPDIASQDASKDFVINNEFADELVDCSIQALNPKYIEFIPNNFDIYVTRILNQSNINKESLKGGFTYYNDLMQDVNKTYNNDSPKINIENQMSAKLQLIIAASDGNGNSYPNFTNSCYAKDIILNLSYIGDRNFKYKDNIQNNDVKTLSLKETSLMKNAITTFNTTYDNYKENTHLKKVINQKDEFKNYIKYKEENLLSKDIRDILTEESIPLDKQKFLDTDKISFNVVGFYNQKSSQNFCKDTNETEKCFIKIISPYTTDTDINEDKKRNFNIDRNSYKTTDVKRNDVEWNEFTFADKTNDKFDDKNALVQISKNFFNDSIKFIDKDYKKQPLKRTGATSVMIGFNLERNENPMNPTKIFIRDFIPNSLWLVSDENRLEIKDKNIENPFNMPTNINIHYYNHDDNESALFYYGSAYAKDVKGLRSGVKNSVYYTTYCTQNCDIFDINTSYNNTVPIILDWYKTPDYVPANKGQDDGDIYEFKATNSSETSTKTDIDKSDIYYPLDKKDFTHNIIIKSDNNNVKDDTITLKTPTYLKHHEKFNVEFIKDNENLWFGDGSVGSVESDEGRNSVGKVLGTKDTDDEKKFDKNLNKNSNRIFW
ncbi:Calx-beta domain-containing protein [Campylobacter sputorum]|uniref:Calx-beta domain-containing protein n=1 Tax=Campylobacter sputorum TaxID=206 RepID=UPI000B77238A|nr:Calx-beta domain-containing protein [Campylobacter sputorum]ASM36538.1 hypothetical protein CSF_0643 [Campylobacter sputorum bv. faecalis CCUG 20703]